MRGVLYAITLAAFCALVTIAYSNGPATTALDPTVLVSTDESTGSGVYIGNHIVITAGHMVVEGKVDLNSFKVTVDHDGTPGEQVPATVLWVDPGHDLAALHIDFAPTDLGTATLAQSIPGIRTKIEVVGNPLSQTFIHTFGHVAGVVRDLAKDRKDDDNNPVRWHSVIPVDVQFTNGNSGGPAYLLGTNEVVGIVVGSRINPHMTPSGPMIFPGTVNFVVPSTVVLQDLADPPHWAPPPPKTAKK